MTQAEAPFTPPKRPLGLNQELVEIVLPDLHGAPRRLSDLCRDKILVVDFWSAECPISKQFDAYLSGFAQSYGSKGVALVAIDSNYYEDEATIAHAMRDRHIAFPILRDERSLVADYFEAQTTPHVFVFDRLGLLRYRGAINDINFQNKVISINYLEETVDELLLDEEVTIRESAPYGCTIVRAWS